MDQPSSATSTATSRRTYLGLLGTALVGTSAGCADETDRANTPVPESPTETPTPDQMDDPTPTHDASTDQLADTIRNWLFAPEPVGLTTDFTATVIAPQRIDGDDTERYESFIAPFEDQISYAVDPGAARTLFKSRRGTIYGATGPIDREGIRAKYSSADEWSFADRYRGHQLAVVDDVDVAAISDSLFAVSAIYQTQADNRRVVEQLVDSFTGASELAATPAPVGHADAHLDALDLGVWTRFAFEGAAGTTYRQPLAALGESLHFTDGPYRFESTLTGTRTELTERELTRWAGVSPSESLFLYKRPDLTISDWGAYVTQKRPWWAFKQNLA